MRDLILTLVTTDAFRYGVFAVACGMYDTVLVVGFDKPKDRGVSGPSVAVTGVRGLPATPAGWFSHCAARYFESYGADVRPTHARTRVEIDAQFVRMIEIAGADGMRVQFDAAQVDDPRKPGRIVDDHFFRGSSRWKR